MTTAAAKAQFLKDNLKPGEVYAGLILGQNGEPDYHLVKLPVKVAKMTWNKAKEFAKKYGADLPTRREFRLFWVNAKEHFEADYYWSGEQDAGNDAYAWYQLFDIGYQCSNRKDNELRVVLVRRITI